MKLEGKVAVVTGASRGIGRATALLFGREGARVVVNYRSQREQAIAVTHELCGAQSILVRADVSREEDAERLVSETMSAFGRVDVLVNNAGEIYRDPDWRGDLKRWQETLAVNLTGAWLVARAVAPAMSLHGGAIVNVSSIYGALGVASALPYSAAKAGLDALTKALAKELAPRVRVNAVAPGNVLTDMTRESGEECVIRFNRETPLKRSAQPDEIARAILFLASDDASFITGHILTVDGGYSLR